jgi:cyclophilin family peptidyl-prolyl cis-trans isomerase
MKRSLLAALFLLWNLSLGWAGTLAQFRTVYGDIEVELYDRQKPITVQNFISYVQTGRYGNTFFHRCEPNFVLQGGGYLVLDRTSTNLFQQFYSVATFPPVTNEFGVEPFISNTYGTIAMAKMADPNSATSQFFFNTANNGGSLDNTNNSGGFTVFGRVISGTNILNGFNTRSLWNGIVDLTYWYSSTNAIPFKELPVTYSGAAPPRYMDLIFVDVTLLQVQVTAMDPNNRTISWNSVASLTNVVEYTTNFPPVWTTLATTNGTGSRISVTDTASSPDRFYRIRVLY